MANGTCTKSHRLNGLEDMVTEITRVLKKQGTGLIFQAHSYVSGAWGCLITKPWNISNHIPIAPNVIELSHHHVTFS